MFLYETQTDQAHFDVTELSKLLRHVARVTLTMSQANMARVQSSYVYFSLV